MSREAGEDRNRERERVEKSCVTEGLELPPYFAMPSEQIEDSDHCTRVCLHR